MGRRTRILFALAVSLAGCDGSPSTGGPQPRGTLFVLDQSQDRVLVIDAASGKTQAVRPRGLARCGARMYVAAGRLVYVGYTRRASVAHALDPRRPRRPTRLGTAHELVPSETPGRVWVARVARCRDVWRVRAVHEMTVGGRVTRRSRTPVPGISMIGALDGGLLIHRRSGGLIAWNPLTGRSFWRHGGAFVLAAGGRLVAWCPREGCGRIRITDIRGGRGRTVTPPPALSFRRTFEGALSPDRSLLAVQALTASGARRLALVDTVSGGVTTVPGSRVDRGYAAMAWSRAGWVFWSAGRGRLMAYRPGADAAVTLPVRLERRVVGMAAGR